MREFLKVHTIEYFPPPSLSSETAPSLTDGQQLQLLAIPGSIRCCDPHISAGQKGVHSSTLYWRKAFRGMQRATVIYETSDLTPASFRTSLFSKQPNKLIIFVIIIDCLGASQLASLDFTKLLLLKWKRKQIKDFRRLICCLLSNFIWKIVC